MHKERVRSILRRVFIETYNGGMWITSGQDAQSIRDFDGKQDLPCLIINDATDLDRRAFLRMEDPLHRG